MKRMQRTKSDLKLISNYSTFEFCYKNFVSEEAILCANETYIEITLAKLMFQ